MKYIMALSSRTSEDLPVEEKHHKLINNLQKVEGVWGIPINIDTHTPAFGKEIVAFFKLTNKLGKGIRGDVMYRYRNMIKDHHSCDDRIFVEFNSSRIDFNNLINETIHLYIEAFDAYSAKIYPEDLIYVKEETPFEIRSKLNLRKNIARFYPFSFMDDELIMNCFGLAREELYHRLIEKGFTAKRTNKGLLLTAKNDYVNLEEAISFNKSICISLGINLPIGVIG